jgi:hypothetical protein
MTAHWTDIIFELQTDPRLTTDRPDISEPSDLEFFRRVAETYRAQNIRWEMDGVLDWSGLMIEAAYVAMSETDDNLRRDKLMRVAALSVAWSDAIAARNLP